MSVEPAEASLGPSARVVRDAIASAISRGTLRPGDKLEPERELALRHGVSRSTLRQALMAMERGGIVRREPGRAGGTFVAANKVDRDLSHIVGLPSMLAEQGFAAGTRVVSVSVKPADDDACAELGLGSGDFVVDLVRIRFADGAPMSLERAMLPAELVPGLTELALGGSLYDVLAEHFGLRPSEAVEHLEVVAATADEAAILGTDPGAPLMLVRRTTQDSAGRPFEYSHELFRGDRVRISVHIHDTQDGEGARLKGRVIKGR